MKSTRLLSQITTNFKINLKIAIPVTVILFILLKFYSLQFPTLQKTLWKEIDYIQISKNFTTNHFKIWEPTISWPAEEPRVTAMEFPLVPFVASLLYKIFGFNVFSVRIVTLIFFVLLSVYLFKLIVLQTNNYHLAYLGMLVSLILPFNFVFGNLLFSEPAIVSLIVVSIFYMLKWAKTDNTKHLVYAFTIFSICLLLKPTAMYTVLPFIYIYYLKVKSFRLSKYFKFGLYFFLSIIPAFFWYLYVYHLTKTSIDVFGIFGGHDKFQTLTMIMDKQWWLIMIRRLVVLFGGKEMFLVFLIGAIAGLKKRDFHLFHVMLISQVAFMFIVAEGHKDAEYRQFAFISSASFFIAYGILVIVSFLFNFYNELKPKLLVLLNLRTNIIFFIACILILGNFTFRYLKYHPNKNYIGHPKIYELAEKINQIKTAKTKLIVAGNYTTHKGGNDLSPVIYYYTNLQGWSIQSSEWDFKNINEMRKKGADIFVGMVVFTDEAGGFIQSVGRKYKILFNTPYYTVCDLNQK